MTRSILRGVQYLHQRRIVHADIQPENILLQHNNEDALLADFGIAINLLDLPHDPHHDPASSASWEHRDFCKYSAPEVLQATSCCFAEPADMWSVGCLVYFMLTGVSPFEEPHLPSFSKRRTYSKICRAEYSFPECHFGPKVSRAGKQFIDNLLRVNESVRMTVDEALDHPWLRLKIPIMADKQQQYHQESMELTTPSSRRSHNMGQSSSHLHLAAASCFSTPHPTTTNHNNQDHKSSQKQQQHHHHSRGLSSLSMGIGKFFSPTTTINEDNPPHYRPTPIRLFLTSPDHNSVPMAAYRASAGRVEATTASTTPQSSGLRRRTTK
jgi:serine/threonine protein kinase